MAMASLERAKALGTLDPVWAQLRKEAEAVRTSEPSLAGLVLATILQQKSLEEAVAHRIAERLDHADLSASLIRQAFADFVEAQSAYRDALRADIAAVIDRDPACDRVIEPVLYFKGFHAIETHRLAHWLWGQGRRDFALYLQSRSPPFSRPTFTRLCRWARACSLITRPASSSVRRRCSKTMSPSFRA